LGNHFGATLITPGSAACCAEWLRLSAPIAPTFVFDHEVAPPPGSGGAASAKKEKIN
jgi:hypothetical protein